MTQQALNPQVGYLRSCMDRRFLAATRSLFQNLTGFKEDEYYHEAFAGGALGTLANLPDLAAKATPPLGDNAASGQ